MAIFINQLLIKDKKNYTKFLNKVNIMTCISFNKKQFFIWQFSDE